MLSLNTFPNVNNILIIRVARYEICLFTVYSGSLSDHNIDVREKRRVSLLLFVFNKRSPLSFIV